MPSRSRRRASVLLVEDVADFRADAAAALAAADCGVVAVATTSEALDRLDQGLAFELLVSRVLMPPGHPHGLALARMVKHRRPDVRILMHAAAYDDLPVHERDNPPGMLIRRPPRGADLAAAAVLALGEPEDAARLLAVAGWPERLGGAESSLGERPKP